MKESNASAQQSHTHILLSLLLLLPSLLLIIHLRLLARLLPGLLALVVALLEVILGLDIFMVSPWMKNGDLAQYLEKNPDVDRLRLVCMKLISLNFYS